MQAQRFPFKTYEFNALVEVVGDGSPPGSMHVRLVHGSAWLDALTWLFEPFIDELPAIPTAQVVVIEMPQAEPRYVLASCRFDSSLSPGPLLPDELCPIEGVVTQTRELIDSIQPEPLRHMLYAALTQPGAMLGFWTTPASLRDHHSYCGGLSQHSLEVATMVANSSGLTEEDRDAGVALALLHDYGKIWCYRDGEYTSEQKRGHVRVGLEKLAGPLESLRRACPALAARMSELLGAPVQRSERRYPLAVGRVVNAFDQMSCEMYRRRVEAQAAEEVIF